LTFTVVVVIITGFFYVVLSYMLYNGAECVRTRYIYLSVKIGKAVIALKVTWYSIPNLDYYCVTKVQLTVREIICRSLPTYI